MDQEDGGEDRSSAGTGQSQHRRGQEAWWGVAGGAALAETQRGLGASPGTWACRGGAGRKGTPHLFQPPWGFLTRTVCLLPNWIILYLSSPQTLLHPHLPCAPRQGAEFPSPSHPRTLNA